MLLLHGQTEPTHSRQNTQSTTMAIRNNSTRFKGAPLALLSSSACLLLITISTSGATVAAFTSGSTCSSTFTHRRHNSIHTGYRPSSSPSSHVLSLSTNGADNDDQDDLTKNYTTEEINTMKTLIESMALEPSDTSRRKRVESTIEQYISDRDDGDMEQAARFATLFDGLLIGMGGEVQDRAREMAQKKAMSALLPQSGTSTAGACGGQALFVCF